MTSRNPLDGRTLYTLHLSTRTYGTRVYGARYNYASYVGSEDVRPWSGDEQLLCGTGRYGTAMAAGAVVLVLSALFMLPGSSEKLPREGGLLPVAAMAASLGTCAD